jgi:hypothetical protein
LFYYLNFVFYLSIAIPYRSSNRTVLSCHIPAQRQLSSPALHNMRSYLKILKQKKKSINKTKPVRFPLLTYTK